MKEKLPDNRVATPASRQNLRPALPIVDAHDGGCDLTLLRSSVYCISAALLKKVVQCPIEAHQYMRDVFLQLCCVTLRCLAPCEPRASLCPSTVMLHRE